MKLEIRAVKEMIGFLTIATVGIQIFGLSLGTPVLAASTVATTQKALVGGDIHTLTMRGSQLVVTGHEHAAVSTDSAKTWKQLKALEGADIMAWATNQKTTFAGGHIGLFVSPLNKNDFKKVAFYKDISDIHSIGASGKYVYLASPQFGLLVSEDFGKTWMPRNTRIGQGFMGSMLVDPKNPLRVLAPDMQSGLLQSIDGGKTWKSLGGPMGTMAIAWNPKKISEIIAIGMGNAGISKNGGASWSTISLPASAYAIEYSLDGKTLYVATLDTPYAHIFISRDGGKFWSMSISSPPVVRKLVAPVQPSTAMDPNMPGMAHTASMSHEADQPVKRPLSAVLGLFGGASALVISSAFFLRRSDTAKKQKKKVELSSGRSRTVATTNQVSL